ncbi:branched-chain amino acid ABC transporter permease [Actinomadura sp. DC4]|uniref:branched-chain amino acid ABC transporter permease n=1 Tax=Actinomadura sp. DC4 TaxID=3055069 RepID=UPI0025B11737|nr:branched-chain amino acid ABC transporter permease [Actinomadura sp. DC4]MDN3356417.1 branched-chain amino acid ABC transporter permease [Actinomadura sp. DC4]
MTVTSAPSPARDTGRPPPGGRASLRNLVVLAVIVVVLIPLPLVLPAAQQAVAVRVLIFALMGIGWNLMSGFGGMFSFGHAAYFGIGAYTGAWLLVEHGVSPWIGMLAGGALAALFGVIIGFLSFRYKLRGAYFALATFAFAEMLRLIATGSGFVHKAVGYNVPLIHGSSFGKLQFPLGSPGYFWVALGLVAAALAVNVAFLRSRAGRLTLAVRDDETAASALGVHAMRYKLMTIALSAAITAVAGVFYVQFYLYINPDLAFGSGVSIQAILPAVIGGVGTIWGPVIGAVILGPLSDVTATLLRNPPPFLSFLQGRAGLDVILYAVLLIVLVLALPRGVYGAVRGRLRR